MIGINIYFGNVVDVVDPDKLNRVRVSIPGKTNELTTDELSWYFPILGMDQLPILNDKIPVIIFNCDFTSGFYFKKIVDIDNSQSDFSGTEYENYLELYKRLGVQLTYNESDGIQHINKNVKVQLLEEVYQKFVRPSENDDFAEGDNKINHFKMTHNRFDLGTDGEATPLGDKTVAVLQAQLALSKQMYTNCMQLFDAIQAGCTNPHTAGIKAGLMGLLPTKKPDPTPNANKLETDINKIQSKKTFIE